LLYLYFGRTEDDLKNFALRDLGILRTNKDANLSARFTDGEEARACFHYTRLLDHLELKCEDVYRKAILSILSGPACTTDYASDLRSRAAHGAGLYFEKAGEMELAAQLYRAGSSSECRERLARLLYATGDRDGAAELLRRMIDDPRVTKSSCSQPISTPGNSMATGRGFARSFCALPGRSPLTTRGAATQKRASPVSCGGRALPYFTLRIRSGIVCLVSCSGMSSSRQASCTAVSTGAALPQGPQLRAVICDTY
jgi:hypothetical protein